MSRPAPALDPAPAGAPPTPDEGLPPPGPAGARTDGAAAFLATLAEYDGCPVERLEHD